jgi:DNA-binding ferritin-like protein
MAKNHASIGQFIAVLFLARDLAHRAHLRTTGPGSFARHEALGDFYPAVVDFADTLAEAYQGCELTLIDIPLLDNEFPGEIKESLQAQRKWIKANRYKAVEKDETQMQNIIDEIVALYDRTIFKLHYLQ